MTAITRAIGSAMATQLERVNNDGDYLRKKVERITESNEELRRKWREAQAQIAQLELALETAQRQLDSTHDLHERKQMHNGRPVLTVKQAVKQTGIAQHTIYCYLRSGHWASADIGNQYLIYADQPLNKKRSQKRGPKAK